MEFIKNIIDVISEHLIPYHVDAWWMVLLIGVVFSVFECFWRRWFGGKDIPWLGFLDRRWFKHTVNICMMTAICLWVRGLMWYWSLAIAIFLQVCFWTLTFGMYFDIGRHSHPPTEDDIKEYNKTWFAPILNWFFSERTRYYEFYDYCGMMIRFTWPALFVFMIPTFNSGMFFIGPLVALAYGLGWTLWEKGYKLKEGPTAFGEYMSGAVFGWFMITCGMI